MPVSEAIQLGRLTEHSLARLNDDIARQQATIADLRASGHETKDAERQLQAMLADFKFFKKMRDRRSPNI